MSILSFYLLLPGSADDPRKNNEGPKYRLYPENNFRAGLFQVVAGVSFPLLSVCREFMAAIEAS
jgi:hypothetical protein